MPLDRPNRTRAANALAAYLRGEIDNFKLDDETLGLRTDDHTLRHIALWLWHFYDDVDRHTVRATPEGWDLLTRFLAFLRSDLDLMYRKPTDDQIGFAPFRSHEEWLAHRYLLDPANLPSYDPTRHTPPRRSRFYSGELRWHRVIAVVAIFFLVVYLVLLRSAA